MGFILRGVVVQWLRKRVFESGEHTLCYLTFILVSSSMEWSNTHYHIGLVSMKIIIFNEPKFQYKILLSII